MQIRVHPKVRLIRVIIHCVYDKVPFCLPSLFNYAMVTMHGVLSWYLALFLCCFNEYIGVKYVLISVFFYL